MLQQIRQTVLTRVGSRAQSLSNSQLDEAPEPEDLTTTEVSLRNITFKLTLSGDNFVSSAGDNCNL